MNFSFPQLLRKNLRWIKVRTAAILLWKQGFFTQTAFLLVNDYVQKPFFPGIF